MLFVSVIALALTAGPAPKLVKGASVEGLTEYQLGNGLKVLLVPDGSKPTVTVNLTLFVGSRHEDYGEKGMAHLLEHLLFKETKNVKDIKKALTERGADANGTTWFDRTNYFETLAANDDNLKWALDLEADRLVNTIITREKLAPEMTVVRNEFEMGENSPSSVLFDRVMSAAYTWHNYGDTTIGARSDIEQVPQERLQAFYTRYYQPDNALLVVAGRFDEAKALTWIAERFGRIPRPRRALPTTYTVEPTQDGERSVTVRRVGGTPVLALGYHVPAGSDPDYAAIDVLTQVLGDSPSGRLYKGLVDSKKAAKAGCFNYQLKEPGALLCFAELNEKDAPGPARDVLVSTVEGLKASKVTDAEVERARAQLLKQVDLVLNDSERVGVLLSEFAAMGDWRLLFIHRDRIKAVTTAEVQRAAEKYLKATNRTLGEYVPTEAPDRTEVPPLVDLGPVVNAYKGEAALSQGEVFEATPKNLDARTTRETLPFGLKLALLPKKTRGGTVRANVRLPYGNAATLMNQRTVADLTARMLTRGTKTKSRQQFKDALDALRAQVSFGTEPQAVSMSLEVRRPQLEATLELVFEALKEPAFDKTEFEALKRELLSDLEQKKDDPNALAFIGLQKALSTWPKGHPFAVSSIDESIADLNAVKLDDVKAFHAKFYGAQAGFAALVGDFEAAQVKAQLAAKLGTFAAKVPYERIPRPHVKVEPKNLTQNTPDKAMACFVTGTTLALRETDPDFPALVLADAMLGGGFLNGRVPQRLREKEGLSYGAGTFLRAGTFEDNGALAGYAISAPENAPKVETGFREELELAVKKGFTDAELQLARKGLLQTREQARASDERVADALAEQLETGRTFEFDQRFDDAVRALSVKDVNAALQRNVDPSRFTVVKVGDFKKVAAPR
ncbi:MAG: insulinase family protein [Myxococcaceae bacterium]|nr:insulinase family protein [Myxococcaceae bacterium]